MLTGFPFSNPQGTVNTPIYGLDNWIYLAHTAGGNPVIFAQFGDKGSDIRYVDREGIPPLKERGRNIRFRPDTGEIEALSSKSQFGQSFDDWGRHFLITNSNHVQQETIAARYLKRNPDLPVSTAVEDISDHMAATKVFPITDHPRFELLSGIGEFTSGCGIAYYHGATFAAEPAHNVVHRDILTEPASLYLAKRGEEGREFLASRDAWFRPVNMTEGPDGALYLMDFYRMIIDHPEWMSLKDQMGPETRKGDDRGRIYRIMPKDLQDDLKSARLGAMNDGQLVAELAAAGIWRRRAAQRLLMDHKATDTVPAIRKLFAETPSPQGRLHALWTLEGLGQLDADLIAKALTDKEAGVRENAIILAEQHLDRSPSLEASLLPLVSDPAPRVRYQLTLTLGNLRSPAANSARDQLLFNNLNDPWIQAAALSSGSDDAPRVFHKIVANTKDENAGQSSLFRQVCSVIGARRKGNEVEELLEKVSSVPGAKWRPSCVEGLNQGLKVKKGPVSTKSSQQLLSLLQDAGADLRAAVLHTVETTGVPDKLVTKSFLDRVEKTVRDESAPEQVRADSLRLVALIKPENHKALLQSLINPKEPDAVQSAAMHALGKVSGDDVGTFILQNWRNFSPTVRVEAGDALYLEPSRERLLVNAIKSGDLQTWTLNFGQRRRLIMNRDAALRAEIRPYLERSEEEREKVVERYTPALSEIADAQRGEKVFHEICSKCHMLNGKGSKVGPDLESVRNRPKEVLLSDILIPSRIIALGYESYVVETNGGTFDGVIGEQSSTTITLRQEQGKQEVIQRQNIRSMHVTNLSAMPGDLENQITPSQMADLLEYVKRSQ